jgi:predicted ATP-grasp superfamily ATP-dependent carboligase
MRIDAVVLGLSPTGLYALRELHGAGQTVVGVDRSPGCARYSRAAQACWLARDDDTLIARLRKLADTQATPPLLLPTNDHYIELLIARRAELAPHFRFAGCYDGVAAELLDKQRFHALCRRHGLAAPGVWLLAAAQELDALAADIPCPCLLKPALVHKARPFLRGAKLLIARTRAELRRLAATLPRDSGAWLVQEIVPGPESQITLFGAYMDAAGHAQQGFVARKLRQYPPGFGSASLALSADCAETRALSQDFLQRIGFHGICGAEFKRDPRDGVLKIIEINPRPTLWFALSHAAGKRIALACARDLRGEPAPADAAQRDGVLWRYALKDLAAARFYRRRGADFVLPPPQTAAAAQANGRAWAVFDGRDPLPALMEPLLFLHKLFAGRA